ncbi:MAG TPA: phosphatase PAP2 family protein [Sphingobium sp.]|nr:phosphatase PAP2 family protein [Sphingobium sp.]
MAARSISDPDRAGALLARLTAPRRRALALLLAALVGMIGLAQSAGLLAPADRLGMTIVAHLRWVPGAEWVTTVAQWLDRVGEPGARLGVAFVIALFLARASRPHAVIWLIVASGTVMLLNPLVKWLFMAPRPDMIEHLVIASGHSFPSGHAAGAMALGGAVALLSGSRAVQLVCAALIAATGLSRVWLGVHWPSDVIGGWAEGAAWLLLMSLWLPEQRPRQNRLDSPERGGRPRDPAPRRRHDVDPRA